MTDETAVIGELEIEKFEKPRDPTWTMRVLYLLLILVTVGMTVVYAYAPISGDGSVQEGPIGFIIGLFLSWIATIIVGLFQSGVIKM